MAGTTGEGFAPTEQGEGERAPRSVAELADDFLAAGERRVRAAQEGNRGVVDPTDPSLFAPAGGTYLNPKLREQVLEGLTEDSSNPFADPTSRSVWVEGGKTVSVARAVPRNNLRGDLTGAVYRIIETIPSKGGDMKPITSEFKFRRGEEVPTDACKILEEFVAAEEKAAKAAVAGASVARALVS